MAAAAAAAAAGLPFAGPPLLGGWTQGGAGALVGIDFLLVRDRQIGIPPRLPSEYDTWGVSTAMLAPLSCIQMSSTLPPKSSSKGFLDVPTED